jgi:hypothetical protein
VRTKAQILANNGKLHHITIGGMDISIENPAGSVRRDLHNEPPKWQTVMPHHYGYIKGTVGYDKDHLDVFIKPHTDPHWHGTVYVVNQKTPGNRFDEHKCMVGFDSEQKAKDAYLSAYEPGWEKNIHSIATMPLTEFKQWARSNGPKRGALRNGQ